MTVEKMLNMIEQNEKMVLRATDPDGTVRDIGAVSAGDGFIYPVKRRNSDTAHTHTKDGVLTIAGRADREIIPFEKSGYA